MADATAGATRPDGAPDEPERRSLDLPAAIILGLAALLTALAAYQAALADGNALQGYSEANQELNDANAFYQQGNVQQATDQQQFLSYAVAVTEGNQDVAEYIRTELMRDELEAAVDWWESDPDALTPFDDVEDNPYVNEDWAEANRLEEQSAVTFQEGADADAEGDQYELANVMFAASLFFGGIGTLIGRYEIQLYMLGVAVLGLLAGAVGFVMAVI